MTLPVDPLLQRIRAATADEYEIEHELGRGGMAAVFLARDIALQRRVAIKVMLPDLVNVQGIQDRFVIEARTAAKLDHPGIVAVYAVKQRAGLLYLVMKLIEGHTLEALLRANGPLDPASAALIASRVAEALHFAHTEGVVHRDVKPSNIMIDARGRPVVTDFGIARVTTGQSITVAGSVIGTPTHISPEQCRGLPATPASDQYALGVTMYEMLTGRVPFAGSLFELITAHREQPPPRLADAVPGIDPGLDETITRMLRKDPGERWGSMAEVAERLAGKPSLMRDDEPPRATLVFAAGTRRPPTPDRAGMAADLLTPPGARDPATPPGSPLSPLPISVGPEPYNGPQVIVDSTAGGRHPGDANGGRVLLWSAAGVLATILIGLLAWFGRNIERASARTDSLPKPSAVANPATDSLARIAARDAAVRDSATRDSADRAQAAIRDSISRDSVAKAIVLRDSLARDSALRTSRGTARSAPPRRATPTSRAGVDSSAASRAAPRATSDSMSIQCTRLLERQSLGERLTDAERQTLRSRCPK